MYLTTPQRYPQFKSFPSSPIMPRTFYQISSPPMSFVKPFVCHLYLQAKEVQFQLKIQINEHKLYKLELLVKLYHLILHLKEYKEVCLIMYYQKVRNINYDSKQTIDQNKDTSIQQQTLKCNTNQLIINGLIFEQYLDIKSLQELKTLMKCSNYDTFCIQLNHQFVYLSYGLTPIQLTLYHLKECYRYIYFHFQ